MSVHGPHNPAASPPSAHLAEPDRHARRALWIARVAMIAITTAMLALLGRVVQLQIAPPAPIAELVGTQRSTQRIEARRGSILDRHGRPLAVSVARKLLFADPAAADDPASLPERIAAAMDYDPAALARAIARRPDSRFVVLDRELSPQRIERLDDLRRTVPANAVGTLTVMKREYPSGFLAGQLIGFVGTEGKGLDGLELALDRHLAGTPGGMRYLRDSGHDPLWIDGRDYRSPVNGRSVRLSLDVAIQSIAEEELARTCREFGAQSGQVIVMDPWTGEVLAMANFPGLDPGDFSTAGVEARRNRTVTDAFEPGSIFKPFIWAAATELGVAREGEAIDCTTSGLYVSPHGRRLRDAHPNGMLNWAGVLIKSSNIGMAIVGQRLGPAGLHAAVSAFGFGQLSGIGLGGESPGIVRPLTGWTHYSETSVPMGQEVAVTGIQMARAFCAIANGGFMVRPSVIALDEQQLLDRWRARRQVILPSTSARTVTVLRQVVTDGTGKKANSKLYSIFGKTGTAQIADRVRGGYLPQAYVASFVAAAPVRHPRLVVTCFVHHPDPKKGHYGGVISAPAVMRVLERSLQYLGVPPDVREQADAPRVADAAGRDHD